MIIHRWVEFRLEFNEYGISDIISDNWCLTDNGNVYCMIRDEGKFTWEFRYKEPRLP